MGVDLGRTVHTGHSNGGFGAWLLAALDPDSSLALAPLAGMMSIGGGGRFFRHQSSVMGSYCSGPRMAVDPFTSSASGMT